VSVTTLAIRDTNFLPTLPKVSSATVPQRTNARDRTLDYTEMTMIRFKVIDAPSRSTDRLTLARQRWLDLSFSIASASTSIDIHHLISIDRIDHAARRL